jgi:hypothetical protein
MTISIWRVHRSAIERQDLKHQAENPRARSRAARSSARRGNAPCRQGLKVDVHHFPEGIEHRPRRHQAAIRHIWITVDPKAYRDRISAVLGRRKTLGEGPPRLLRERPGPRERESLESR